MNIRPSPHVSALPRVKRRLLLLLFPLLLLILLLILLFFFSSSSSSCTLSVFSFLSGPGESSHNSTPHYQPALLPPRHTYRAPRALTSQSPGLMQVALMVNSYASYAACISIGDRSKLLHHLIIIKIAEKREDRSFAPLIEELLCCSPILRLPQIKTTASRRREHKESMQDIAASRSQNKFKNPPPRPERERHWRSFLTTPNDSQRKGL